MITPVDHKQGRWELLDTMSEPLPEESDSIFTATRMHLGGIAHLTARTFAAAELLRTRYQITGELEALADADAAATMLFVATGSVFAQEAKLRRAADGGLAFLPKGARKKGFLLNPDRQWPVLVVSRYGGQYVLAAEFQAALDTVPATVKCNWDGIPPYTPESQVQAAYLITHPGFGGGKIPGCLFFALGHEPEDGISDGYMWSPPSEATSEHGSSYCTDIERWGGRIPDWVPDAMTLTDCFELPTDPARCYAQLAGYVNADPDKAA